MNRFLLAALLCALAQPAFAVDTDGDGLLDLIDVPGFDPNATGELEFESRGIQDLDGASLLTGATHLDLFDNLIGSIERGDFLGLSDLEGLAVSGNRITSIESGAFEGLSSLKTLSLDRNSITNIESGAFLELNGLERLYLNDNQITGIASGVFLGRDHLLSLDLHNNQIETIENGTFHGLGNLQSLALEGNHITSLESGAFEGLGNLYGLALELNRIASIERGTFQGLGNLGDLRLQDNQITDIESAAFEGLDNLNALFLHQNQLTSIDSEAFLGLDNLRSLYLTGNPIAIIESGAFQGMSRLNTLLLNDVDLTELNFTAAGFESLIPCSSEGGLCIESEAIGSLLLDRAELSQESFAAIVGEANSLTDVSLVGLRFTDGNPASLSQLLSIPSLDNVTVDLALFNGYGDEFSAFDAVAGNTVTVVFPQDANPDTNGDGMVDLNDLNNVRNNFGVTGDDVLGDTNGDDVVDINDLNNVRNYFGISAPHAVPEPRASVLAFVTFASVAISVRRRRTLVARSGLRRWRLCIVASRA